MPIRKVSGGYKWGGKGKVYPTRAGAAKQAAAAYASGYQGKNQGGSVMLNKQNAAKELAYIARTQGKDAAMSVVKAYQNMLTPADMQQAMSIVNMNCGGMVKGYNSGGNVPRYNQGGGLLNHPYEREGEQFDTVPAMLTPGEFVVDADSAHKFGDELEQINNWEPNGQPEMSGEEYLDEDEAVEIKRKFKDGTEIIVKSPEGSKTEVSGLLSSLTKTAKRKGFEPQKEQMNRGGLLYANTGLPVPNVPQPAGILTPQQQQQAQSQQLAGVGFSLLGAQGAGQQLSGMGRRALEGHQSAVSGQQKADQEAAEETQTYESQISFAEAGVEELGKGAGAVINFAISPTVRKLARAAAITETRFSGLKEGVNLDRVTDGYLEDAINNYWGASAPELKSYYRLRQVANELRVIARQKIAGQGQVTEGEADVVYNTVFGFDQPADTVASNLMALRDRAAAAINKTVAPLQYESTPAFVEGEDLRSKLGLNISSEALEEVGETAENLKQWAGKKLSGVKGTGTQEDPYEVPLRVRTLTGGISYDKFVDWLDKNEIPGEAIITFREMTGTVDQLLEILQQQEG